MTRLLKLGLTLVLGAFLFVGRATAADDKAASANTYMIIAGVGDFKDPTIKARPTAPSDAKAIYDVFTDKTVGGIPPENVQLLISGKDDKRNAKNATRANLLAAFKTLAGKSTKNDKVIVVWIGQGASTSDRTLLFAGDSTFKDRAKDAISATDLEAELKNLKSKEVFVLIDADLKAFDTEKEKETVFEPDIMDIVRVFMGVKEKDADAEFPPGRAVILSGSGVRPTVIADGKEGIFTRAVVAGLRGAADTDGYEPDGVVTVDELTKYLEAEIPNLARKYGKDDEAKQQQPFAVTRTSHFVLSKNPAVAPKVAERLRKFEELSKQQKLDKEVVEQGEHLLSRMPALKSMQQLRKDYQALADGKMTVTAFTEARDKVLAGMRLDDDAASSYAQKSIRGLEKFKAVYIKELQLGEMVVNAIKGLYSKADQKVPPELEERLAKAKSLGKSDLVQLLQEARIPLGKREDFDKDRDVELSLQYGIAKFVDPYTAYIDRERVEKVENEVQGFFTGIGVQIRRDVVRDGLLVVSPIKGSPAYKAGLKAGDLITAIRREVDNNGKKLDKPDERSTKGMKVSDAVTLILGKPGTKVKVVVEKAGGGEQEYEITRGLVEVESVLGFKRNPGDDSWDYFIDPKSKIAYIQLTQFARKSFIDMEKVMKELDAKGVKGLILDLRFNPGGYLDVARDICDLFIDDGLIVTIKPRVGDELPMFGKMDGSYQSFPMACLVNGSSASGSEILAACLQDHNRAIIVGERSYGKGSVQNIQPFEATGGQIKLTTATFWRPNGKNLNKSSTKGTDDEDWGVRPDKNFTIKLTPQETGTLQDRFRDWGNIPNREVKSKETEKPFDDRQLDAALKYIRQQIDLGAKDSEKTARR